GAFVGDFFSDVAKRLFDLCGRNTGAFEAVGTRRDQRLNLDGGARFDSKHRRRIRVVVPPGYGFGRRLELVLSVSIVLCDTEQGNQDYQSFHGCLRFLTAIRLRTASLAQRLRATKKYFEPLRLASFMSSNNEDNQPVIAVTVEALSFFWQLAMNHARQYTLF